MNKEQILKVTHQHNSALFKYTKEVYSAPSYLFYGDHIITSKTVAEQGDPEGPPVFCDGIKRLAQNITSELNIWYLDDDTFAGEYNVVFKDFKFLIKDAEKVGLSINPSKCEIAFRNDQSVTIRQRMTDELKLICYGFGITPIEDLVNLCSPFGYNSTIAVLREKTEQLHTISQKMQKK